MLSRTTRVATTALLVSLAALFSGPTDAQAAAFECSGFVPEVCVRDPYSCGSTPSELSAVCHEQCGNDYEYSGICYDGSTSICGDHASILCEQV